MMIRTIGSIILFATFTTVAFAQPEVMAWGNLTGLRVEGHLLELSTSMCVAQPESAAVSSTGREKQQNNYSRNGKTETVTVRMRAPREFRDPQGAGWTMAATEVVEDTGPGTAKIDLEFTSANEAAIGGALLGIELPASVLSGGSVQLIDPDPPTSERTSLAAGVAEQNEYLRATAKGARFASRTRQIEVTFNEPTLVIVRDDRRKGSYNLRVLLAVLIGKTTAGQTGKNSFAFKVTGEIDKNPVGITLDASHPGQIFDGLGGNFRQQKARIDPQIIAPTARGPARQSPQPRKDGPHQGLHRGLPALPQGEIRRRSRPVQLQRIRSRHQRPSNPGRSRRTHQTPRRQLRRQGPRHQARARRHLRRQPHRFHPARPRRPRGRQVHRRRGFPLLARMH